MSHVGSSPPWPRRGGCASNKNDAKPPQPGADGAVRSSHRLIGSWTNRPVRSIKGGFATFLLMGSPFYKTFSISSHICIDRVYCGRTSFHEVSYLQQGNRIHGKSLSPFLQ
jgi:hypothetical protein